MEPWEALDVDDSDLPSLLRPCKRLHRHETSISTAANSLSQAILTPCSHTSPTLTHREEAGGEQQREEGNLLSDSHSKSEQRFTIPGPAGAVQAAMLQKIRDRENHEVSFSQRDNSNPIPTQEYIRRAVENAPEFDDDFSGNPWLSALHYIGIVDGVIHSTPLSSIKECTNCKVDQIVAVIKSCSQNCLGGLMVTLKDPTGAIGASINQKVLSESNLAWEISVGSVLILQKVAVFSPSYLVHYLNIMPRNLVKVFSKDVSPPLDQNRLAHSIKYGVPGEECFGKSGSHQRIVAPEHGTREETMDEMGRYPNRKACRPNNNQIENNKTHSQHLKHIRFSLNKNAAVDKEPSTLRQDTLKGFFEAIVTKKTGGDEGDNDVQQKEGNPQDNLVSDDVSGSLTKNHIGQENQSMDIVQKESQQLISSASFPEWTDEQLKELFAGDDENLF